MRTVLDAKRFVGSLSKQRCLLKATSIIAFVKLLSPEWKVVLFVPYSSVTRTGTERAKRAGKTFRFPPLICNVNDKSINCVVRIQSA